jgi:hypothetical protein
MDAPFLFAKNVMQKKIEPSTLSGFLTSSQGKTTTSGRGGAFGTRMLMTPDSVFNLRGYRHFFAATHTATHQVR